MICDIKAIYVTLIDEKWIYHPSLSITTNKKKNEIYMDFNDWLQFTVFGVNDHLFPKRPTRDKHDDADSHHRSPEYK